MKKSVRKSVKKTVNNSVNQIIRNATTTSSVFLLTVLAGCGGKIHTPANQFPAKLTYSFVTPKLAAQSTFADTVVDNLGITLNRTLVETIAAVNTDGSFTANFGDPSQSVTVSGTVDQTFYPTAVQYNSAGQTLSYVVTPYSANPTTCAATPHLGEAPSPFMQAENWTLDYSLICGSDAPINYSQIGAFQDMEQLVVPAGTFNAYRFTSVINYIDAGLPVTKYVSTWVNALTTDSRLLQETVTYVYTGTAPDGSIVSDTKALSSFQ